MIVQHEFLNKLRDFGLNSYESKLWTALLSRGVATAGELSDIANVPRSRSYDVLESLERKGFIILKLGKPIKYVAVSPAEVLERIKKKIVKEADKKTKVINSIKESDVMDELKMLHAQGITLVEPADLTGVLRGRGNLYSHLDAMIKNADKSVLIMTTEEGLIRKADALKNTLQKAKARGVKVKLLAPVTKRSGSAAKKLGGMAQVKHLDQVKGRFLIIDGKEAALMLLDDKEIHPTYDVGIWITTKFFAKMLEGSFHMIWDTLPARKK